MSKTELNPEVDLSVNVANLDVEFRTFPSTLYRYSCVKADAAKQRDIAKATLKEVKAATYKRIKSDVSVKHTEKSMEAEIDTDQIVMDLQRKLIDAEHTLATLEGSVESMRAKKDMLIQLGSDRRKEM